MRNAYSANRGVAGTLKSVLGVAVLLIVSSISVEAQTTTRTGTDQMTPSNLGAGSPAGSYALSGFDTISLFNGNLNFRLPLLAVGGRGSGGYTMMLSLNTKSWHVKRTSFLVSGEETNITYTPTANTWQPNPVGYGPGFMTGRKSGEGTINPACTPARAIYEKTITRLTFTGSDGTEFEFVDALTSGQPHKTRPSDGDCNNLTGGFARGRVFVTAKGEAATFISDTVINDINQIQVNGNRLFDPNGYMFLRDGVRYRIINGLVSWIQDRNGNRTTFTYEEHQRVSQVTDSLNRQVNITYDNTAETDCSAHYDEITFKGFAAAARSIKIWHQCLHSALRSDQTIKNYTDLFPRAELNGSGNISPNRFDKRVISAVTLPDGRQYQFFYNSYAEVARVVLPTGGAYEYDYTATSGVGDDNVTGVDKEIYRRVIERRVMPDGTNVEGLTRYSPATGVGVGPVKVDQFAGNGTTLLAHDEHTFHTSGAPLQDGLQPFVILYPDVLDGMEDLVEAMDTNGTTALRQELNTYVADPAPWTDNGFQWSINGRLTNTLTKLLDVSPALVSKRHIDYGQYNNPTSVKEYAFGSNGQPGALVRQTTTSYVVTNNGANYATVDPNSDASLTVHLRSLPQQQSVYDAGSLEKARTTYEYDNYNQTTSDNFHDSLTNCPNITGLDSAYTTTHYTRGNGTKVTRSLFDSSGTVTGSISSYAEYDIAGNVVKTIDPRSTSSSIIATTFDFSDAYGYADTNAEGNELPLPVELPSTAHTYAFPTKVTNALNQNAYIQYDYYLGKPVNSKDSNGIVSKGRHDDLLDRPTGFDVGIFSGSQLQSHTSFVYNDSSHLITTQSDQTTLNDGVLARTIVYDGLGRTTETRTSAPEGTIFSKQEYDAMGRLKRSYNPYRTTGDETYGYADMTYDALGRVLTVTTLDGAVVGTSYLGNSTTVTDQASRQRRSITDGLGRLIRIDEPDSAGNLGTVAAPTQPTLYAYDVLDDLTTVTQDAQPSRTFLYDSLKRLTDATNPESGHVQYTYDESSNLKTKLDARGITTTYSYDVLNRVITRIYGGDPQNTPMVSYKYDGQSLPALPAGSPTFDRGSSIGRLVAVVYGSGNTGAYQGYDQMGRVVQSIQVTETQATGSPVPQAYGFNYSYNLASEMLTETYPSGRIIQTEYDTAGRVSGVKNQGATPYYGGGSPTDAANRIQYAPHGAVSAMKLGSGKWDHTSFNNRLQPTLIGLGTSDTDSSILRLDYGYGTTNNNGNVLTQKISAPGLTLNQCYGYDSLNRLASAEERSGGTICAGTQQWKQAFIYDRFGNRTFDVANTTPNVLSLGQNPTIDPLNNRFTSGQNYGYDSGGNLTSDPATSANGIVYDAENRQIQYTKTGQATNYYYYDGDGHRVKKIDSGGTTVFVYNVQGQLIAEYHNDPVPPPAGGGGTSYLTSDHLGSTRVVTKSDGTVKARYDYLPFGEELGAGIGGRTVGMGYSAADSTKQKFTQKERDNESGLDYFLARYYSSAQGRFTSPDEFIGGPDELFDFSGAASSNPTFYADLTDPQSLNKYQYCYNNPLLYIDPDGHQGIKKWIQDTLRGAAATFNADNGLPAPSGDQTTTGRTIGHLAAITQGVTEVVTGGNMIVGGGTEAVVTSPAATTVVGAVVPAAGVGVAVVGGALVMHGGGVLINTTVNIFKKGDTTASNSQQQSQPQQSQPGPTTEVTPRTNSNAFEPVKGSPAKRNKETGEIWVKDRFHKDHYEVYKNQKKFENGKRNRSVWEDGRPKEKF